MRKKIKAVVIGCGDRASVYCHSAYNDSEDFQIVAVIDPDIARIQYMQKEFNIPESMCFRDMQDVLRLGKIADCVINGTMDKLHVDTSIPFLEQGYDMLLEKPITNNKADLLKISKTAKDNKCKLMICHVLRYAPFYRTAKELILSKEIGEIVHIETSERVGLAHSSISYIRGKWNNEDICGSSMLLAKCCHDLDLICWFNNTTEPINISSFGGRNFIIPEKAPIGAGTRCMVDCSLTESCQYSAKPIYLDNNYLPWYPWQCTGKNYQDVTYEEKEESLKTYNPHGLCAYKTNANIVDHQTVSVLFKNGSTATHSMLTSAMRRGRSLYIHGTNGEIEGWAGDGILKLRKFDKTNLSYTEKLIDFNNTNGEGGGHFGGDKRLIQDFISLLRGEKPSISCTSIDDSVNGHLCVYYADYAMKNKEVVNFDKSNP